MTVDNKRIEKYVMDNIPNVRVKIVHRSGKVELSPLRQVAEWLDSRSEVFARDTTLELADYQAGSIYIVGLNRSRGEIRLQLLKEASLVLCGEAKYALADAQPPRPQTRRANAMAELTAGLIAELKP